MRNTLILLLALLTLPSLLPAADDTRIYGVGGPLYGVELPLFPTQQGEPAGYPGALVDEEGNFIEQFNPGGQHPQRLLYPGSVENFRYYWFHYIPARSMFDEQSLLQNFLAADLAVDRLEEFAAPIYLSPQWGDAQPTGKFNAPVPVVRTRAGDPAFELDLGNLEPGLYVVRIIAAVATDQIQQHRKPLIVRMSVNDGLDGGESTYRMRTPYVDEFYSVAEFYFHAPVQRDYRVSIAVEDGSMVDLLIHNIDVHDALAGTSRRPIKTRSIHALDPAATPGMQGDTRPLEERLNRDRLLWNSLPPINAQRGRTYGMAPDDHQSNWPNMGAGGLGATEIEQRYGRWISPLGSNRTIDNYLANAHILLRNEQLGLIYTLADYRDGRPLPDPYPFKDDGLGVFGPSADGDTPPQNWHPVADGITTRWSEILHERSGLIATLTGQFQRGNYDAGRDAALLLIRTAYSAPAFDARTDMSSVMVIPGPYGRDMALRRRINRFPVRSLADNYDVLFAIIAGNQELADSVSRFVPWVQSPEDVQALVDSFLLEHLAKSYMRYHYHPANAPQSVALLAAIVGDNEVTLPWMQWTFSRSFTFPQGPAGIQDSLVSGFDRDGMHYIGSTMYVTPAIYSATALETYVEHGGDPQFSLINRERYPAVFESLYSLLRLRTAGPQLFRTGSVTGAEKDIYFMFDKMQGLAPQGWSLTGDPIFAWMLVNLIGRQDQSDEQWAAIVQAAQGQRAPWLENRSRVLTNLAAYLESGTQHDDYRFRRSAALRIGQGYGHAHNDTLALQVHAHGMPLVLGGGQRHGYSHPSDTSSRVHSMVTIDGQNHFDHAWVPTLADADGARYLRAQANIGELYERQLALIDVDEGTGSVPLTDQQLKPRAPLSEDVVTASSYVFDVFRVIGGEVHRYGMRGGTHPSGGFTSNVIDPVPLADLAEDDVDRDFLNRFRGDIWAGQAPPYYVATFTIDDDLHQRHLAPMWSDDTPRRATRLHMLTETGDRALSGAMHTHTPHLNYMIPLSFLQRSGEDLQSAFVSVIEPFAGEPFIDRVAPIDVADNESDALRAVAVEVTLMDARRNILFADGRPEKNRRFGDYQATGEFAYLSHDDQGLRQATLAGGTLLTAPGLAIRPAAAAHTARIAGVDYASRVVTLDKPWSALTGQGRVALVGSPQRWTQVTFLDVTPTGDKATVQVQGGADFYLSRVYEVDEANNIVTTGMEIQHKGLDHNWTASNEDRTRFWRADYLGGDPAAKRFKVQLHGDPVRQADFGELGGLYLWEYGAGDSVRLATNVNLQRLDDGSYQLTSDIAVDIELNGRTHRISQAQLEAAGGVVVLR